MLADSIHEMFSTSGAFVNSYQLSDWTYIHTKEIEPEGYWEDIENRRRFLTAYAMQTGFDPTIRENWENCRAGQLRSFGVNSHSF